MKCIKIKIQNIFSNYWIGRNIMNISPQELEAD